MTLNDAGRMIEDRILAISDKFGNVLIDSYVVMPNHIHFIITLGVARVGAAHRGRPLSDVNAAADTPDIKNDAPGVDDNNHSPISGHDGPPLLADVIGWFKASATNYYIRGVKEGRFPPFDRRLWQRNYYEHIIQTDAAYKLIDEYIQTNPQRWAGDKLRE